MRLACRIVFCLIVIGGVVQAPLVASANPGISVDPLGGDGTVDGKDLVNALVGGNVTVDPESISYTGAAQASGSFSSDPADIVGFGSGVLLTSGNVNNVIGPNDVDGAGAPNGLPGDAALDTLSGHTTFDASVLEFDFTTTNDHVFFRYVFGSEEYNEYVGSSFNDAFGFYVNGDNCATITGQPVTVNTINGSTHPDLFRNNERDDFPPGETPIDTELDGLTTALTCSASVNTESMNHVKLAIADASDSVFDSAVFLEAGSFTTTPPPDLPGAPQNVSAFAGNASAIVDWNPPADPGGSAITSYTVTSSPGGFTSTTADGTTTHATVNGLTNGTSYTFTVAATNGSGTGPQSEPSNAVTPTADSDTAECSSGCTVSNTGPQGSSGSVLAPTTVDEVFVSIVRSGTGGGTTAAAALDCGDAICLDVSVSPSNAYGSSNPLRIVLKVRQTTGISVKTRPVYKDQIDTLGNTVTVLIGDCLVKNRLTPPPDGATDYADNACVTARQVLGKGSKKFDQIQILATSDDPKYRT